VTIRIERQATGEWVPLVYCSFCFRVVPVASAVLAREATADEGQHTLAYVLHADVAGAQCQAQWERSRPYKTWSYHPLPEVLTMLLDQQAASEPLAQAAKKPRRQRVGQ
jgi:hypothetical protein